MADQLTQLKQFTKIVADTGEISAIQQYEPLDATTNPSLLYKAAQIDEYKPIVDAAIAYAKEQESDASKQLELAMDKLFVAFGAKIAGIVPGVVSTEVDARLSFDTQATVAKALRLIELYEEEKVDKQKILIKIASTWEGIRAAEILERDHGVHCNMTLLFSLTQAVACADANATLISPFVGRITDWYKAKNGVDEYKASEDPGVQSVTRIYNYYKKHNIDTIIMGASFRNKGQILELAGCDKLTISPKLLQALQESNENVVRKLQPDNDADIPKVDASELAFRWAMNEDAMATEKLAEGIRRFAVDARKLEDIIREKL